jgi:hypothetical protein
MFGLQTSPKQWMWPFAIKSLDTQHLGWPDDHEWRTAFFYNCDPVGQFYKKYTY